MLRVKALKIHRENVVTALIRLLLQHERVGSWFYELFTEVERIILLLSSSYLE